YKAAGKRFACGHTFTNLMVVNFTGPFGARACAYCCNMNIDLDGEPQAYGPLNKRTMETWGHGGWKSKADNDLKKPAFEEGKKAFDELEKKTREPTNPAAAPAKPAPAGTMPAPAAVTIAELDKQIKEAKARLIFAAGLDKYEPDLEAKNFGTIFWHWY